MRKTRRNTCHFIPDIEFETVTGRYMAYQNRKLTGRAYFAQTMRVKADLQVLLSTELQTEPLVTFRMIIDQPHTSFGLVLVLG